MGHTHTDNRGHHHHHHHQPRAVSLNRIFTAGIALNVGFVLAEFGAGFWFGSLGLLSDAGHNLSDVASLVLAMLAFRLAKAGPTTNYTYGLKKSTVLVSLLNAVILLIAVGIIISESIDKFLHPQPVEGGVIAWIAGIGVLVNGFTARLFLKDKDSDLNVKGAYLHMAADALVSVGVVVSGIIIMYTGWYVIDPVIGILIALVIVYSTWGLLRDSLRLSLDGVPSGVNLPEIEKIITSVRGVENVHHLHVWPISTTETALTAHIVLSDISRMEEIKEEVKQELSHTGIQHATLESELPGRDCSGGCG
ncbi:MAG: cation diffusion facilitator family transporter [Tannerellaceae bacterium]|jgi:cobalt-zinc-cadmium efflux system protein|nr:cation diffusion facilitator family transporter [Tannerellaceae bacterium]